MYTASHGSRSEQEICPLVRQQKSVASNTDITNHASSHLYITHTHGHSYLCDDYVLNDNEDGDIHLVQSLLGQVASQRYQESYTRSGRVIKPAATFMRTESR